MRNRGTLGGNICVNDPTNHFPPLLVALGATMTIRSASGERTVPADEFFVGVFETAVGEGDLLTRIDVPAGGGDGMSGVTLGAHGTYIANAAASVTDGAWRVVLGCVAAVPVRATAVEERLAGSGDEDPSARRSRGSARHSTRRPTSTRPRTTGAASPRPRSSAPSCRHPSERRGERAGRPTTSQVVTVTVNGVPFEKEVPARRLSCTSCATIST